ncbi:L-arabonate dehydratase [Penicillium canariense]|uniref:L-arabonate dehydratase n=1 Tax=Penicillium canariense TaxID=189055 RepID=A0A9W9HM92_9EURO|nr:L-arabonate dehydratase [Penicillium canariense]KAJ5151519.1 L-arabonate dehydratase [Penicillium canariense]
MVYIDLKPSDLMTREVFENTIVVNVAIGGTTNAPIYLSAIAYHPVSILEKNISAGGLLAIMAELLDAGKLNRDALTCNGRTLAENGILFDCAIMKTHVISPAFRQRYLSNSDDPEAFEGSIVVFDGPEDYHSRIE